MPQPKKYKSDQERWIENNKKRPPMRVTRIEKDLILAYRKSGHFPVSSTIETGNTNHNITRNLKKKLLEKDKKLEKMTELNIKYSNTISVYKNRQLELEKQVKQCLENNNDESIPMTSWIGKRLTKE